METASRPTPRAARNGWRTAPDRSARRSRLRSPFLQLRRHLELDRIQKPGSSGVRKDEQPVMPSCRRRPFLLPRLRLAEEVDFAQTVGEGILDGEVSEKLERRARLVLRVVPGLEQKQPAVIARAVGH